jgi:Domain of unknown function (DUF3854)
MHISALTPNRNLRPEHLSWLSEKFGEKTTVKPSWVSLFVSLDPAHLGVLFPSIEFKKGGIALLDSMGNIHQIKSDIPIGDAKYLTVSADPGYIDWCSEYSTVIITEGWGKACAAELVPNTNVICLSGVSTWQAHLAEIKRYCEGKRVVIAFDSDSEYNAAVDNQQQKLAEALGAGIIDFGHYASNSKGLDDLVKNHGKKALIHCVNQSAKNGDRYFIPDEDRFMEQVPLIWGELFPDLIWTGTRWYESGEYIEEAIVRKRWIDVAHKLYFINQKTGAKKHPWVSSHRKMIDGFNLLKEVVSIQLDRSTALFLANGKFDNGVFYPGVIDPRRQSWGYDPDYEPPHEIINFLQKNHGSLVFRHWMSALLRNDDILDLELTGAIMGLLGESGSGKSFTMSIAKSVLQAHSKAEAKIDWLMTPERLAGIGNPRLISNNDVRTFPGQLEECFTPLEGKELAGRRLYGTDMVSIQLHARFMFAAVTMPSVQDTTGGIVRRIKEIECSKYPSMADDCRRIAKLLKDPAYIERLANWALAADVEDTASLLNTEMTDEIHRIEKSTPLYRFLNTSLLDQAPLIQVTLDDLYKGYVSYNATEGRKYVMPFNLFVLGLERFQVSYSEARDFQKNGKWVHVPSTVDVRVNNNLCYNENSEPVWRFRTQDSSYFGQLDRKNQTETTVKLQTFAVAIELHDAPIADGKPVQPCAFTDVFENADIVDLPAIIKAVHEAGIVCVRKPTDKLLKDLVKFRMDQSDRTNILSCKVWAKGDTISGTWLYNYGYDVYENFEDYANAVIGVYQ